MEIQYEAVRLEGTITSYNFYHLNNNLDGKMLYSTHLQISFLCLSPSYGGIQQQ